MLLGIYLAKLGFAPVAIGAVLSAGLAVATFIFTFHGDRLGRRRTLIAHEARCISPLALKI